MWPAPGQANPDQWHEQPAADTAPASLPACLQLLDLTRLRTLNLVESIVVAGGYDVLLALPELRRLKMVFGRHLPSCLSQLTQLTSLYLEVGSSLPFAACLCPTQACLFCPMCRVTWCDMACLRRPQFRPRRVTLHCLTACSALLALPDCLLCLPAVDAIPG